MLIDSGSPLISPIEFQSRRFSLLSSLPDDAVFVIASSPRRQRNHDVYYPYRPDSSFFYLTGYEFPQAFLILLGKSVGNRSLFFCENRSDFKVLWEGAVIGPEEAKSSLLFDETYDIETLQSSLKEILSNRNVFCLSDNQPALDEFYSWDDIDKQYADKALFLMRSIKSDAELACLKKAADITSEAHDRAMRSTNDCDWEYQLESVYRQHYLYSGCPFEAYPSIVASGKNACILHYQTNKDALVQGDLVLVDSGCEYQYYASDVTRTFPIKQTFTDIQKECYELVLSAQKAALAAVKPGVSLAEIHQVAVDIMIIGLQSFGLLPNNRDQVLSQELHRPFIPHSTSHLLGLDVHDVSANSPILCAENMCLTIEPGLYFPERLVGEGSSFKGIGIRIEDDVSVTSNGCQILSSAPKEIDEIEAYY